MKKAIDKELKERVGEPKKIRKVKVGKIKYATKNSILESVTGFRRQKVQQLLRCVKFNEMRLIGNQLKNNIFRFKSVANKKD